MGFRFGASLEELRGDRERHVSGLSEIRTDYAITEQAKAYIDRVLDSYAPESRAFYLHVLMSARRDRDFWVPVPWHTIVSFSRTAYCEKQDLIDSGLLEEKPDYRPKRCKEYRVPLLHRLAVLKFEHETPQLRRFDPLTGRVKRSAKRHIKHDPQRHPWRSPMIDAMEALSEGRFDVAAFRAHLDRLRDTSDRRVQRVLSTSGEMAPDEVERALLSAYGRYDSDARNYMALLAQKPRFIDGTVVAYDLAYKPTTTGRLSHIGGGLQSCTREGKAAAYARVEGVRNYDLHLSQATILRAELQKLGLDAGWLDRLIVEGKESFALRAGVPPDVFKECIYAVCFGAALRFRRGLDGEVRSIREIITRYVDDNAFSDSGPQLVPNVLFRKIEGELKPLDRELRKYRRVLADSWLEPRKRTYGGKWLVANDAGAVLRQDTYDGWKPSEQKRRLASFVLQGIEAGYIHALTARLPKHGVLPISNEHDGLVTIGEISLELAREVAEERGVPYLELKEKPFAAE